MGLRIFGAIAACLLLAFVVSRRQRGQLRRGEVLIALVISSSLLLISALPDLFDPILSILGFERGQERRIIGLLVISNLLAFALIFRGMVRSDLLSNELGTLVESLSLRRLRDEGWSPPPGACVVVIPAFDEAENLSWVLGRVPESVGGLPVAALVVADGCTDETEAVARSAGAGVIGRDLRRGSGAAVNLGYKAALAAGARIVVTLDADGQHDPAEMDAVVAPLLAGEADMVQGSRTLGSFEVESAARARGVKLFGRVLSRLAGTRITDPSTGYRAMKASALAKLDLRQEQFYVSELILEATRSGARLVEVPITLKRRAAGVTKKPTTVRYAWGFSKAIVKTWLR